MVDRHSGFITPFTTTYSTTKKPMAAKYYRSSSRAVSPVRKRSATSKTTMTKYKKREPAKRVPTTYRYKRKPQGSLSHNVAKGIGSTFSKYTRGSGFKPKYLWLIFKQNQEYSETWMYSARIEGVYGKQIPYELFRNTTSQLSSMRSRVSTSINLLTAKFYVGTTMVKTTFTNQDVSTAYIKMYELAPRFHNASANPIVLWDRGYDEQKGIASADYTDAYQSPFISQEFCLFWKVEKVITFELAQGQSHCHMATYHINRPIYGQIMNANTSLKDISTINMVVASGTPINDSVNQNSVSTSSIAIDIVESITTSFTAAANVNVKRFYTNTLPAIAQGQTISIGSGAIANDADA